MPILRLLQSSVGQDQQSAVGGVRVGFGAGDAETMGICWSQKLGSWQTHSSLGEGWCSRWSLTERCRIAILRKLCHERRQGELRERLYMELSGRRTVAIVDAVTLVSALGGVSSTPDRPEAWRRRRPERLPLAHWASAGTGIRTFRSMNPRLGGRLRPGTTAIRCHQKEKNLSPSFDLSVYACCPLLLSVTLLLYRLLFL